MKSAYRISNAAQDDKRIRAMVVEEVGRLQNQAYDFVQDDVLRQVFAVCCMALHHHFGFGADRLKKFKQAFEAEVSLMEGGIFGKTYTTRDVEKWLLEKMGLKIWDKEGET